MTMWFTQSAEWEELQRREGRKTYRIAGALVIEYPLPFGKKYWEVSRGPERVDGLEALKNEAKKSRPIFLRVDPPRAEEEHDGNEGIWRNAMEKLGFREAPKGYYFSAVSPPPEIAVVDLTRSEEDRLANTHEKTRYNIRLAERKGVQVEFSRSPRVFGAFWHLLSETARREKFTIHTRQHYVNVLDAFSSAEIGIAVFENEPLVAGLFLSYGSWYHYLHGGSTRVHREVMAPYLLHWRAMERAREQALEYYDFGGIAPEPATLRQAQGINHPWMGETRFKLNFGASRMAFLPAQDLVLSPAWYGAYLLARKLR